jgi:hypothetical protein
MVASLAMMMTNLLQTTSWKRFYQQTYFPVRIVLLTKKPGYNSLRTQKSIPYMDRLETPFTLTLLH